MLKVIGSQESGASHIEFGTFLPFKFWHQANSSEPRLYWRTGDLRSTFLEMEIDSVNGQILGVSLLLPGEVKKDFPTLNHLCNIRSKGYPRIDPNDWQKDRFRDDVGILRVFANSNHLLIAFSESITAERVIFAGNITFGMNKNDYLIWILIDNLPEEKLIQFACSQ